MANSKKTNGKKARKVAPARKDRPKCEHCGQALPASRFMTQDQVKALREKIKKNETRAQKRRVAEQNEQARLAKLNAKLETVQVIK